MCGIMGEINLPFESKLVESVEFKTNPLIHCSPNREGHWIEKRFGLDHRIIVIIGSNHDGHQGILLPR